MKIYFTAVKPLLIDTSIIRTPLFLGLVRSLKGSWESNIHKLLTSQMRAPETTACKSWALYTTLRGGFACTYKREGYHQWD